MDRDTLKERTRLQQEERKSAYKINQEANEIEIDKLTLELVENFKNAFDADMLAVRYTPLMAQYDYIVGDISADQLRLKGFYQNDRSVSEQQKIMTLQDYLYEYVNFGAPYFVLENINPRPFKSEGRVKSNARPRKNANKRSVDTTNHKPRASKAKVGAKVAQLNHKKNGKRAFIIKQK